MRNPRDSRRVPAVSMIIPRLVVLLCVGSFSCQSEIPTPGLNGADGNRDSRSIADPSEAIDHAEKEKIQSINDDEASVASDTNTRPAVDESVVATRTTLDLKTLKLNAEGGQAGAINQPEEIDRFKASFEKGLTYHLTIKSDDSVEKPLFYPMISGLYDSDDHSLEDGFQNLNQDRETWVTEFVAPDSGIYIIAVRGRYENTGSYVITLSDPQTDVLNDPSQTASSINNPRSENDGAEPSTADAADSVNDAKAEKIKAEFIAVGGTKSGSIADSGEIDWFRFTLEKDTVYLIGMEGADSGKGTLVDPQISAIHDEAGIVVATQNSKGCRENARVKFTPKITQDYFVDVRSKGSNMGTYTMTLELDAIIQPHKFESGSAIVDALESDIPSDRFTPITLALGSSIRSKIDSDDDADWIKVELEKCKKYAISIEGAATQKGTLVDPILGGLFTQYGFFIVGTNDDNSGFDKNAFSIFIPNYSAPFFVKIAGPFLGMGTYVLTVTEIGQ